MKSSPAPFFLCIGLIFFISVFYFTDYQYEENLYLNLSDTVEYVGIEACKSCHYDKYQTFIHNGMGSSFGVANKSKSMSNTHADSVIYDIHRDFYYHPYWNLDTLMLEEYRLDGIDTIYNRVEKIDYIIGSGQHTNSHIYDVHGYLHQAPFTYYTQEGRFDLPPGYENGFNTRFNRKIGLECMSCHNALPDFVLGSENKFETVHLGISCERCHGPGELHVNEKMKGNIVDTSLSIDYTIVNPAKIGSELQFEICSRCHLQGNTVLEEGKSFFDFKPGMRLEEVMNVFLPRYERDDSFIMASHVDRLKMSECFIHSDGELTCVTCHNPHKSIKSTGNNVFNNSCNNCHQIDELHKGEERTDCVSCHMPKSGSIDIPHVTVSDHKIAIPYDKSSYQKEKLKKFVGLYCINNDDPSELSLLRAYLQQYEKFEQAAYYLDSAYTYLSLLEQELCIREWIQYYFLKSDYTALINWFEQEDFNYRKLQLNLQSYSNDDAWAWYRVGESYYELHEFEKSYLCFKEAALLAPYHLEIQNKYAIVLSRTKRLSESKKVFEFIIRENPKFEKSYANYGYLLSMLGEYERAEKQYKKAIALNPDQLYAWLNYASYYLYIENVIEAKKCLNEVLRIDPNHNQALQLLNQLR